MLVAEWFGRLGGERSVLGADSSGAMALATATGRGYTTVAAMNEIVLFANHGLFCASRSRLVALSASHSLVPFTIEK